MEVNPDENFGKLPTSDVSNIKKKKKKKSTHMSPSIIETIPSYDGITTAAVDTISTAMHHKKKKKKRNIDKDEKCGEVIDEDIYGNEQVVNSDILVTSVPDVSYEPLDHHKSPKKKKKKDKIDDNVELSQEQPTSAQVIEINPVFSDQAEESFVGQKRKRHKKKHKVHTDKDNSESNIFQNDSTPEHFDNHPDFSEKAEQTEDAHKRKRHKKKHKIHIDRDDSESNVFQEDTQQEHFDDNAKNNQNDDQNIESKKKRKHESNSQDVVSESNNIVSSKQSSNDLENGSSVCWPKKKKKKKHKHKKMSELQNENDFNEGERSDNGVVEHVNTNSNAEADHDAANHPELLAISHNQGKIADHYTPPSDSSIICTVPDDLDTTEEPVEFDIPLLHSTESVRQSSQTVIPNVETSLSKEEIKKGRFLEAEDNMILKNWKDFTQRFGFASPVLFGVGVKSLTETERKTLAKFIKAKHFYVHLAKGLDNRLIRSVYEHARMLLYPKPKTNFTVDAVKDIVKYHKLHGDNWLYIAQLMNESNSGEWKGTSWTETEEKDLVKAVLTVVDISHVNKLSSGINKITWKNIAHCIKSRKWNNCRKHWLSKVIKTEEVKKEWSSKCEALLLYMLNTNPKEHERDVDWIDLCVKFKKYNLTWINIMYKWVELKKKIPHKLKKKTYKEVLDYLNHHYMPKLLKKSHLVESDLVKALEIM